LPAGFLGGAALATGLGAGLRAAGLAATGLTLRAAGLPGAVSQLQTAPQHEGRLV
jgi:hypothetical protein